MTEILKDYLKKIRGALKGWMSKDIDDSVSYYEEFIEDALEQGLSEKQIINKLGSPEKIVKTIKAENNIRKTEDRPGPLKLMKSIIGVPAMKVSAVLGAIVPIVTAYLLYILSVVSYIAIAGGILFSIYAIHQIDPQYARSIIGMIGLAFISAAVFGLFGFIIWRIANLITLHTMKILRQFLNNGRTIDTKRTSLDKRTARQRLKGKKVVLTFLIIFSIGVVLLIPSGLPARYFSIWNSRMPYTYTEKTAQFNAGEVKTIIVETLNSKVLLKNNDADRLKITYQQPDWMEDEITREGSGLSFKEIPNGRLPYMKFVSRHEGMTAVTVELPLKNAVNAVTVRTNGGTVEIPKFIASLYNLSVKAGRGKIVLAGKILHDSTLEQNNHGKGTISIKSSNGEVIINPEEN